MKSTDQSYPVVLFNMLFKVALIPNSKHRLQLKFNV